MYNMYLAFLEENREKIIVKLFDIHQFFDEFDRNIE